MRLDARLRLGVVAGDWAWAVLPEEASPVQHVLFGMSWCQGVVSFLIAVAPVSVWLGLGWCRVEGERWGKGQQGKVEKKGN